MTKKLKLLFDYQRFEAHPRLEALIRESEDRLGKALTDESLSAVNAAGEPFRENTSREEQP